MFNVPPYYALADGRIWSVADAAFVAADNSDIAAYRASGRGCGTAPDANGELTADGLRAALAFYGLPLGSLMPLADAQAAKRQAINAGFNAAMSASLTMPSASAAPSTYEVATALYDWRTDDPEGYASLLAIHTARRDALLATVDAATTIEAVQAIAASYAV